ncbi:MAG: phosphatidate cytidylyltransferase [Acidobacteriota bacterium]|nr:phosphatidate cytidylyltransferase [Acidobacteriota bacterium]
MSRLITAIGLLAIAFYLIFFAPDAVFAGAALLMSVLCYREYATLVTAHGIPAPGVLGILGGICILFWPYLAMVHLAPLTVLVLLTIAALIAALRRPDLNSALPYTACVLLGALYTFAPWRFSIDLRRESVHLVFFALASNWAGDSVAFYVGRAFGKHRLAPIVSPKKSWEGAIASVAGSVLLGILYLGHFLPRLPWWEVVVLAMAGNVAGQFGDLAESAFKRGAGVKDSGNLLPGHGGMLDRMDSSLFALPVIFAIYSAISK